MAEGNSKFRLLVKAAPGVNSAQLSFNQTNVGFKMTPLQAAPSRRGVASAAIWHLLTPEPSSAVADAGARQYAQRAGAMAQIIEKTGAVVGSILWMISIDKIPLKRGCEVKWPRGVVGIIAGVEMGDAHTIAVAWITHSHGTSQIPGIFSTS